MRRSGVVPFYFIPFLLFIMAVVALRQAAGKDIVSSVSDKMMIEGEGFSSKDCVVVPQTFNKLAQSFPPSLKLINLLLNTHASKIWCTNSVDIFSTRIGSKKRDLFFNPWNMSTRAVVLQLQQFKYALMNFHESSEAELSKVLDVGDQRILDFKKLVIKKKRNKLSLEENILFAKYANVSASSLPYEAADLLSVEEYSKLKSWPKSGSFLFSDLKMYYQLHALTQGGAVLKSYAKDLYAPVLLTPELWKREGGSRLISSFAHLDELAIQVFYPEVYELMATWVGRPGLSMGV